MFGRVSLSGVGIHLAIQSKSLKNNQTKEILVQRGFYNMELIPNKNEAKKSFNGDSPKLELQKRI